MSGQVQEPLNLVPAKSDEQSSSNHANGANGLNGDANGSSTKTSRFDPNFTDAVIAATGPKANPRLAKVMASLTRHLHDFCRENEITVDEFMAAIDLVRGSSSFIHDVAITTQISNQTTRSMLPASFRTRRGMKAS